MYMIKKHRLNTIALSMLFLFTGSTYAEKNGHDSNLLFSVVESTFLGYQSWQLFRLIVDFAVRVMLFESMV
ncbi:hypothetical protein, partial [Vibrio sp. SG41-7]|uniref:hypothetical protein n=1 Tax=Vibrio sp. SG41-7 TaxID=2760973 RepID=UPI001C719CAB